MTRFIVLVMAAPLILISCRNRADTRIGEKPYDVTGYNQGRLVIEKISGATRIAVKDPWQNTEGTEMVWYLVPHDSGVPAGIDEKQVIRVPVSRIVCMSTTHIAMLRALQAESLIIGISGSSLVYDSLVLEAIRSQRIKDVGYEGNLDRELIISLQPDLIMAYGVADPSSGSTARLTDAGMKVFYNADYLEQHPLARCEWLRLFGLLTGRERIADSIVTVVKEAYNELAAMVCNSGGKSPEVLLGAPWEDVWYVSPGNTYIGRLIQDAGGKYIYADLSGAHSVPFSVESVFRRAVRAEIWINPGTADRLSDISAADHRLATLPLLTGGRVWNNRKRINQAGGNDYWESAVVRPDLLLKDFISIIHPELMPGYVQYYYRRLE